MILVVIDIGYWLIEAIDDDQKIFDVGEDRSLYQYTPGSRSGSILLSEAVDISSDLSNAILNVDMKRIRNLLNINSFGDAGDVRDASDNYMNDFEEEDEEVPSDSLEVYLDSYIDVIYIYYRSSYILKSIQKVLLNEKQNDIKMWAQRAIAYIKYIKILKSKRLYCR